MNSQADNGYSDADAFVEKYGKDKYCKGYACTEGTGLCY